MQPGRPGAAAGQQRTNPVTPTNVSKGRPVSVSKAGACMTAACVSKGDAARRASVDSVLSARARPA